jgi:hypothetical protein
MKRIVITRDEVIQFAENLSNITNGYYELDDAQNVIKTNMAQYDSDLHTWNYDADAIMFNIMDDAFNFDGKYYTVEG